MVVIMSDQSKQQVGSTTEVKLKAWIDHLKKVDVAKETAEAAKRKKVEEQEFQMHLHQIEQAEEKLQIQEKKKRELLRQHLSLILIKQKRIAAYNALSLMEKRIYQALAKWHDNNYTEDRPPHGILELHFKKKSLVKIDYERIDGDIGSTLKIKKMKGSEKLKEMLLVFNRGKNILLDLYNQDLKENIFTFMFVHGEIQSHQRVTEVARVIRYFKEFHGKVDIDEEEDLT